MVSLKIIAAYGAICYNDVGKKITSLNIKEMGISHRKVKTMNNNLKNEENFDEIHEECGVFGVYDLEGEDIASSIYYGLCALQHRGQESCGIAVTDTNGKQKVHSYKGMGLVNDIFTPKVLDSLHGNLAIGHVRYATAEGNSIENAQPLVLQYIKGTLALAHNGCLVNADELRKELAITGAIFQTTIDSEIIAYYIARERLNCKSAEEAVQRAMTKIKGAYSLIIMSPRKMIGARDPLGLKPLCIGRFKNTYVLASESCALDSIGAEFVRDVLPGEIVTINQNGLSSDKSLCQEKSASCIFEYIYFARPDSSIDGVSVYESRITAGKLLAKSHPVEADLVIGVPDSGNAAALGYAEESKIPFGMAFVKNSYVGRTFIKPKQSLRESSVRIKLNVLKEVVNGKRIVMIDDSIVRGTTCEYIVKMLKSAGATEVHLRISSPPFKFPCYYGTDVSSGDRLIANEYSLDGICKLLGADSLGYLTVDSLKEVAPGLSCCNACFIGEYPV